MATRAKLAFERLALQMFDMQLRYGPVVRERQVMLHFEARCIGCGQLIEPGWAAAARWERRPTTGLYAHVECPPLRSEWLEDEDFYQVFDYFVRGPQTCADCRFHPAGVRVVVPASPERFSRGGIVLRYVCTTCVEKPVRRRE